MTTDWRCPICGSTSAREHFRVPDDGTEGGVDAESFRPSAAQFGATFRRVVRCGACGHGSLAVLPEADAVADAYAGAVDELAEREQDGQIATAHRSLAEVERLVSPGRVCDLGCWTGSFLVAAAERGWEVVGIEPSAWASERARQRGLDVRTRTLEDHGLDDKSFRLVVMADVLEHLADPGAAVDIARQLLEPGGVLLVTAPDAGSLLARAIGRRWWSVLPMHLQYFTRSSMADLLEARGLAVRSVGSHAKVFTARYYAERLGGYSRAAAGAAVKMLERVGFADRLIAPDLRDRMVVLAVRDDIGADDPFVRHARDVGRTMPGGDAGAIKRTYQDFGRYLEDGFGAGSPPLLSLPETAAVVARAVPRSATLVLDAGCGPSPVAASALAADGRVVVGLDIGAGMVRLARDVAGDEGVPFVGVVGDVEHLPFRGGAFDAVVSDDTIEHLPDDRLGASELARVAADGAVVVVATPNRHSLQVLWRKARDRARLQRRPPRAYFSASSHLREYTPTELRAVLEPRLQVARFESVGWHGAARRERWATRALALPGLWRLSRMVVAVASPVPSPASWRSDGDQRV